MEKTWILLGMMGAGKSAVGRALAEISGRNFQDTDLLLQNRLGRPISQLFELYGEQAFRDHETKLLSDLQPDSSILATGGGIIIRDENWVHLRRLGHTIYLKAEFSTLRDRLAKSKKRRPLLETEEWEVRLEQLLESRLPIYGRADISVEVDGLEIDEAAQAVLRAIDMNS
jgi:shikimate kinase